MGKNVWLVLFLLATLVGSCKDGGQPAEEQQPPPEELASIEQPPPAVTLDVDSDGILDPADNCPSAVNAEQEDANGNGIGDACEIAEGVVDTDADGTADEKDNCPLISNADQVDANSNSIGDACEAVSGPDVGKMDSDKDGVPDVSTIIIPETGAEPSQQTGAEPSQPVVVDNCPLVDNSDQADKDGNGIGDACQDSDSDGVIDINDNCPSDNNTDQKIAGNSSYGEACDADGDSVLNVSDNCSYIANAEQTVCAQGGNIGAACDKDCDGIEDGVDNCPELANADQADVKNAQGESSSNGIGDVCEVWDSDNDGSPNVSDNCPNAANSDQNDLDKDGSGNVCDTDIDGDGYSNEVEVAEGTDPNISENKPADLDSDGTPDTKDKDADNDSIDLAGSDCDDLNDDVSPGLPDVIDTNGVDSNCDGVDGNISKLDGLLVATDGLDSQNCGVNVQSACKTIKYAINLINVNPKYKNVKYILLAVSNNGSEFKDNFVLPPNVDLRGGYCALEKGSFNTKTTDFVTEYWFRKRDIKNCVPTVKNISTHDPILAVEDGQATIEVVHFDSNSTLSPAISVSGGSQLFTQNKIDADFIGIQITGGKPAIQGNDWIKAENMQAEAKPIGIDITSDEDVKIIENGTIYAKSHIQPRAIKWHLEEKHKKLVADISKNKEIKADGKGVITIDLENIGIVSIKENTAISAMASEVSDEWVNYAINVDKADKLNIIDNVNIIVAGVAGAGVAKGISGSALESNIKGGALLAGACIDPNSNGHCFQKASGIDIFDGPANINNINVTALGIEEVSGIKIFKMDEGEIKDSKVYISGEMGKTTSAVGIDAKGFAFIGGKVVDIKNNNVVVEKVQNGDGVSVKTVKTNTANIVDNKIYANSGHLLTGMSLNGDVESMVNARRNAIVIGNVTLNGTALMIKGYKPLSSIEDNLFYGGWLNAASIKERRASGINIIDSSPSILFNTIIGGTSTDAGGDKDGKVYALTDAGSSKKPTLKLVGNILSSMTTFDISVGQECYKYGIFLGNGYTGGSTISYNFFHALGTEAGKQFNSSPYYGTCFAIKSPAVNMEEQLGGDINMWKGRGCGVADCFEGNLAFAFGLGGKLAEFEFAKFNGVDVIPKSFLNSISFTKGGISDIDLLGHSRLFGQKFDIGALEFVQSNYKVPVTSSSGAIFNKGGIKGKFELKPVKLY